MSNSNENIFTMSLMVFLGMFASFALFHWIGNTPVFWCGVTGIIGCVIAAGFAQYKAYQNKNGNNKPAQDNIDTKELSEGIERYISDSSYRFTIDDSDSLKWQKNELNYIFEEASSTSRLKQELVRNVAHEIKTPLTSLQIIAEGLEDGIFTVDDGTSLPQITESVERLNTTVKMMSAYVSSGADALRGETSDLATCLINAYEKACKTAEDHGGVQVSLRRTEVIDGGSVLVNMSAQVLDAVLYSVVSNAFEHAHGMKNLVLSLEDEIHPVSNQHMAKVSIADDGCGAPSNMAYKMCEPFWKADESHTLQYGHPSSPGLGLSIVKEMIQGNGGKLDIQCAEGQGTCVSIWLPVSA